jgi:hypothetical protein
MNAQRYRALCRIPFLQKAKDRLDMTADIQKDLQQAFPGIEFRVIQKSNFFHSTLYRLTTTLPYPGFPREILLKKYREKNIFDAQGEYFYLESFYRRNTDTVVSSPLPVMMDADRQSMVTEFVPGQTVKTHLLRVVPDTMDHLDEYNERSALALARFHSVFMQPLDREVHINSPLLGSFGENEIRHYTALLSECTMTTKVQAFIDFSPQNLIINGRRIFLIDFPDRECICTPHLDIARWKFNLKLLKQFPRFRFLKLNRWDDERLFRRFIKKYCSEMHVTLNEKDAQLIDFFLGHYAKKLISIYADSDSLRLNLEYRYLSGFLQTLADQCV